MVYFLFSIYDIVEFCVCERGEGNKINANTACAKHTPKTCIDTMSSRRRKVKSSRISNFIRTIDFCSIALDWFYLCMCCAEKIRLNWLFVILVESNDLGPQSALSTLATPCLFFIVRPIFFFLCLFTHYTSVQCVNMVWPPGGSERLIEWLVFETENSTISTKVFWRRRRRRRKNCCGVLWKKAFRAPNNLCLLKKMKEKSAISTRRVAHKAKQQQY